MNMNFYFDNPTKILFGSGQLNELGKQQMPGKKAMFLTSAGKSAKVSGAFDRTLEQLKAAGVEVALFNKVMENPLKEMVMEGAAFARENSCDFIVALGGGAVLDSSVAISAMATNDGDLWDYVVGGTGKGKPLAHPGLPIVTITPVLAVVDPELMRTVPSKYTAYQGFDALFHNTEVMMSNGVNVLSETIALDAIRNIAEYLPRAVKDGNDLEAREHVAYGSTMAGMTMQLTSTTAQHSMEHSLSAYHHDLPHGAGLIMISKAFAEFFIERHACDEQFIKMAKAMGIKDANKPEDFITALVKLQEDCNVADLKMSDYGVTPDEFMTLAKGARSMQGGLFAANPCEMTDEDCAAVFEESFR